MIRPADKGGGIVILGKEKYQEMMKKMLEEETCYQLARNPVFKYKKELEQIIHLGLKKELLYKKRSKISAP